MTAREKVLPAFARPRVAIAPAEGFPVRRRGVVGGSGGRQRPVGEFGVGGAIRLIQIAHARVLAHQPGLPPPALRGSRAGYDANDGLEEGTPLYLLVRLGGRDQ